MFGFSKRRRSNIRSSEVIPADVIARVREQGRHFEAALQHPREFAWCSQLFDEFGRRGYYEPVTIQFCSDHAEMRLFILSLMYELEKKNSNGEMNDRTSHPEGLTIEEALVRCVLEREIVRHPELESSIGNLSYEQKKVLAFDRLAT